MNETEFSMLTKEKLLDMYEELSNYVEELEDRCRQIENNQESYEEGYGDGLAEGKEIGYEIGRESGYNEGYEACQDDINLRLTEQAR